MTQIIGVEFEDPVSWRVTVIVRPNVHIDRRSLSFITTRAARFHEKTQITNHSPGRCRRHLRLVFARTDAANNL